MASNLPFDSKVVVVTGAAGGLGRAVAQEFASRGATVVGLDRQGTDVLKIDLLSTPDVNRVIGEVVARHKKIDVLCNIAGGFRMGKPVHETPDEDWDAMFAINVRAALHACRAVVPHMLAGGGGKIVNIGAFAAQRGAASMGAYTASKAALIRLTESMAAELRERNINVNCVLPTVLDTPQNRADMPSADPRRWVATGDLAKVIVFLASEEARAIHGAAIPVTGLS